MWNWFQKRDKLSEEIRKLEKERAEMARVSSELEHRIVSQSDPEVQKKAKKCTAKFIVESVDGEFEPSSSILKIDQKRARNRFIVICLVAAVLVLLILRIIF